MQIVLTLDVGMWALNIDVDSHIRETFGRLSFPGARKNGTF